LTTITKCDKIQINNDPEKEECSLIENEIFEMILEKYYDELLLYCLSILGDERAAEDCVQEVFLLFYQKRKKLYLSAGIRSWLYKTAANIVKKHLKKYSKNWQSLEDLAEEPASAETPVDNDLKADIIEILGEKDGELFIRYVLAGYGGRKAIAEELGISVAALYDRINKMKKTLVEKL